MTPANCPKLEIAFVNKFSNFGTKIEFVCSHLIKVCLFPRRERRWEVGGCNQRKRSRNRTIENCRLEKREQTNSGRTTHPPSFQPTYCKQQSNYLRMFLQETLCFLGLKAIVRLLYNKHFSWIPCHNSVS